MIAKEQIVGNSVMVVLRQKISFSRTYVRQLVIACRVDITITLVPRSRARHRCLAAFPW
jgi:hypothetical protein